MRRVLIVANQTAGDERLLDVIQALVEHDPCAFELVVPVTPLTEQEASLGHSEHLTRMANESGAVTVARHRLQAAKATLAGLGITATGEIGDPNPIKAVAAATARHPADLIVVSTLAGRRSRWLKADVPERLRRKFAVPVLHVEAAAKARRADRRAATLRSPLSMAMHR